MEAPGTTEVKEAAWRKSICLKHTTTIEKKNNFEDNLFQSLSHTHSILHTVPVEEGLWLFFIGF